MNKIAKNTTPWGKWFVIFASLVLCIGIGLVTTPAFAQVITDCTGQADGTSCDDGDPTTVSDQCAGGVCAGTGALAFTNNNNFTMVDPTGTTFGGTNDVVFAWDLTTKTSVTVSGQVSNANLSSAGPCPFFGVTWSAHDVAIYGPGSYTVYTSCPAGSPGCGTGAAYTFTVTQGQLAAHMLFDYGPTKNIDVVDVWTQHAEFGPSTLWTGDCTDANNPANAGASQVWDLMSTDWNNDGKNSVGMLDGPFPAFGANFNVMVCGNCDDNNACTTDTCNLTTGLCEHTPKICSTGTCDPVSGHCPACADVLTRCDDGNICTTDGCDEFTGSCTHDANFINCSNNNACEPLDFCSNKVCNVLAKNCDDGNSCTTDSCDPATGHCGHVNLANGSACDDSDACTTGDVCTDGVCAGTFTPNSTCNVACSPAPTLVYPTDGQGGLGTTLELRWTKCGDTDGDPLKYHITYCITPGAEGCPSNLDVADASGKNSKSVFYASGAGLLMIGMTFIGGLRGRKKIIALLIMVTLLAGGAFISCKNTKNVNQGTPLGNNEMNIIISGLTPSTTYYWRVEADDNRPGGLVSSPSQSFTTQ